MQLGLKRSASMVVLRHQDQWLLLRRSKSPNKGKYVPVGGKLEPFESPRQAALRETAEETGIEVTELHYAGFIVESAPNSYNWQVFVYWAEIPWQPAPYCDEGELEWIKTADVLALDMPATDPWVYYYIQQGHCFAIDASFDENLNLLSMREEHNGVDLLGLDMPELV